MAVFSHYPKGAAMNRSIHSTTASPAVMRRLRSTCATNRFGRAPLRPGRQAGDAELADTRPSSRVIDTAAVLTQGLAAWAMLFRAYPLKSRETILVHAVADGIGSILARWAKALGATVIGTVAQAGQGAQAKSLGIDHVLQLDDPELASKVRALNGGRGVDVVYELVGKTTFLQSILALRVDGQLVHAGNASGHPGIGRAALAGLAIGYVEPNISQYFTDPVEVDVAGAALIAAINDGVFGARPRPITQYGRLGTAFGIATSVSLKCRW